MQTEQTTPSSDQLELLERVARTLARTRRMSPEDTDDFVQSVCLRLAERRYDVFARFDGRCSLRAYLAVVVRHLLLDWQNHTYGRWRPTAVATRLGPDAIRLDRLINRDQFTAAEAVALLARADGPSEAALTPLAEALPKKARRRVVSEEVAHEALPVAFDDLIATRERKEEQFRARVALAAAIEALPDQERRLIELRFNRQWTVQAIARDLSLDAKALYRHFERILKTLRTRLQAEGVERPAQFELP